MIILTSSEAALVRGISPTVGWAALSPILLLNGTFMLSEAVLSDPNHADAAAFLQQFAGQTVASSALPPVLPRVGPTAIQISASNNYNTQVAAVPKWQSVGPAAV